MTDSGLENIEIYPEDDMPTVYIKVIFPKLKQMIGKFYNENPIAFGDMMKGLAFITAALVAEQSHSMPEPVQVAAGKDFIRYFTTDYVKIMAKQNNGEGIF